MNTCINSVLVLRSAAVALAVAALEAAALAGQDIQRMVLSTAAEGRVEAIPLDLGQLEAEVALPIDSDGREPIEFVVASLAMLDMQFVLPDGTSLSPADITARGWDYTLLPTPWALHPLMAAFSRDCKVHWFFAPFSGVGEFRVRVLRDPSAAGETAVAIVGCRWSSPFIVFVVGADRDIVQTDLLHVQVGMLDGNEPALACEVTGLLYPPDGPAVPVSLHDDGTNGDSQPNDGVYWMTRKFADQLGTYTAEFAICHQSALGEARRQLVHTWRVHPERLRIGGAVPSVRSVDDDHDGKIDALVFECPVQALRAGRYRMKVYILTETGRRFTVAGERELQVGPGAIVARAAASQFLAHGLTERFKIRLADFDDVTPGQGLSSVVAASGSDDWVTPPPPGALDRPDITITGNCSIAPLDPDGDGLLDALRVRVEVEVAHAGTYQFQYELATPDVSDVAFVIAQQELVGGRKEWLVADVPANRLTNVCYAGDLQVHALSVFRVDGPAPRPRAYRSQVCGLGTFSATQFEGRLDCNHNGIPDCEEMAAGLIPDCDQNWRPEPCDDDCNGDGIPDACQALPDCDGDGIPDVCERDADCNGNGVPDWCEGLADCNNDGVPDDCQRLADCNRNGVPDACETESDCDYNGVPDECELVDCNGNGRLDQCDILSGRSADCDRNGVPDECQICCEPWRDLNENGVLDVCEPECLGGAGPTPPPSGGVNCPSRPLRCPDVIDCDGDGLPDWCALLGDPGLFDCNHNGVPDACELPRNDCNGNGRPDDCDIADGTSTDVNCNGRPDECECIGDLDGDGDSDQDDLDILLFAFGIPGNARGDLDCDGDTDQDDLDTMLFYWPCAPPTP